MIGGGGVIARRDISGLASGVEAEVVSGEALAAGTGLGAADGAEDAVSVGAEGAEAEGSSVFGGDAAATGTGGGDGGAVGGGATGGATGIARG